MEDKERQWIGLLYGILFSIPLWISLLGWLHIIRKAMS